MAKEHINLTEAEWSVMECLWEHSPRTGREVTEHGFDLLRFGRFESVTHQHLREADLFSFGDNAVQGKSKTLQAFSSGSFGGVGFATKAPLKRAMVCILNFGVLGISVAATEIVPFIQHN